MFRDELLALGWPTSAEVGQANDSQTAAPALWAKTKRDAGELLGVWILQKEPGAIQAFNLERMERFDRESTNFWLH
ncbi:MAG: hypothetical protein A2213_09305 [Lysobacterales bacterium RIFOXYA1_FULL_68_6]|nr:MAG: hypothetical protein A2213_09305 [Xanthomonadales bacterium RIFOXYA1_FULL_68_6]